MKNSWLYIFAVASPLALFLGCGGDSASTEEPPVSDSGAADTTADTAADSAQPETSTDTGAQTDSNIDSGIDSGVDTGTDTGVADSSVDTSPSDTGTQDSATDTGSPDASDGSTGCVRVPGPDDFVRKIVVAHPYDAAGKKAANWEVLQLDTAGKITPTGKTFVMGRGVGGEMVFTPDGKVGLVPQEDGSLGVMRFDDQGNVVVVHTAFAGKFYAAQVVMPAAGDHAYILDSQWETNGGGVYRVNIACDGTLTEVGKVVGAQLPYALVLDKAGAATTGMLVADKFLDSATGQDVHAIDLSGTPKRMASVDAFITDDPIVGAATWTADGKYFLASDISEFSNVKNRIAIVQYANGVIGKLDEITPMNDPVALVASPYNNAVLSVSGYGNAIVNIKYDPASKTPFTIVGAIANVGTKPQLPSTALLINRGQLKGRVLVVENEGIRQVQFNPGLPAITDLGMTAVSGTSYLAMTGAMGVQR